MLQKKLEGKGIMRKKLLSILFIVIFICITFSINVKADDNSSLYLDKLDFKVYIHKDGSMDVTETWNIDIKNTNTLYKTFKKDKDKYTSIENVKVKDVTANKELTQINEEMYHVTKDCYYGLENSKGRFEIAWGIGLDNEYDTRKYEISYTVKDAIAKYNDYAEIYWQFVGADFEIDADTITGTIILPEKVENIKDILVWGHTENLNGEIYVINNDTIKFKVDNFNAGRYVEVRSLFPNSMIESTGRTYNKDIYNTVIEEETKWAKQANLKREWENIKDDVIAAFVISVIAALCIIFIEKAVKYGKKIIETKKLKPEEYIEYFRELPEKDATPGEALYVLEEPYSRFNYYFGKIFSATLLNLKLKDYIDLKVEKNEKNKEKIYIKKLKEVDNQLKSDEADILRFVYRVNKSKDEIEIKELEKYIKNHSSSVLSLIENSKKHIESQLKSQGIIDESAKKQYQDYSGIASTYFTFAIVTLFWAFPFAIVLLINGILCSRLRKKANVLTQKGVNLKEKWKGLKKYMEDFSLLNEKEIPAIEVWEHYLVYATAFGIADKVLKQLKTIYPNIDEIDTASTSTCMYFMFHSNFSSSFSGAINSSISSSISSSYSSGSGGGGGFSGGGGGGRWPEAVEVEDETKADLSINFIFATK